MNLKTLWNSVRQYQQPRCLFRGQYASTRLLRREAGSGLTPVLKTQVRNSSTAAPDALKSPEQVKVTLPVCCPGCGAYSQTVEPNEPGYYGKFRKQTRKLLSEAQKESLEEPATQDAAFTVQQAVDNPEPAPRLRQKAVIEDAADTVSQYLEKSQSPVQVCDRCHDLLHHNKAVSAVSPTIHSIGAYLDESPHKRNRIYHIIDAADFPMSVVNGIYKDLELQEQRSRNRRSATYKYKHGKQLTTISFVITRSDLLGPTKELVDSKMEYVRSVLREKLNISSEEYRMGNVHMISAHRGWWTKKVKEEMSEHGGGLWIVGKANAGKSSFVQACIPKDSRNLEKLAELIARRGEASTAPSLNEQPDFDSDNLLPPAPKEDLYPVLPVVSSLPGTTVSPIRIPFGRGKGEIIDLPGLDRGDLADYVLAEYKRDLIMTKRGKPERHTIKPGQSLLIGGGLVRISPLDPETIFMASAFIPIETHLTRTDKAVEMQAQERSYPGTNIVKEGTGKLIKSAGTFDLKWDVTRSHLPTSIAKAVADHGIKPPSLPYKVMSVDILIEGCGWVELTAQIRAKQQGGEGEEGAPSFPQVEVFSPEGKHVEARRPIQSWEFHAKKAAAKKRETGARGRRNVGHMKRKQTA
ncbi:uncharacterized protein DSM5745_01389 [Aspergillus mulundensis]|uniref:Genetic interactor of prohibitins 3, mitochondrial n=1 Tax=Aspergillus mulundensis TaxID=1810919 RepID=A0A3D8T677_9EURO|nr:hypothetical protein DSM5745_01389 [Aspergillus mulundensis]RDW94067.1 hypothetical protein DSM5745_01389 [Aspergillus mulundensis]